MSTLLMSIGLVGLWGGIVLEPTEFTGIGTLVLTGLTLITIPVVMLGIFDRSIHLFELDATEVRGLAFYCGWLTSLGAFAIFESVSRSEGLAATYPALFITSSFLVLVGSLVAVYGLWRSDASTIQLDMNHFELTEQHVTFFTLLLPVFLLIAFLEDSLELTVLFLLSFALLAAWILWWKINQ